MVFYLTNPFKGFNMQSIKSTEDSMSETGKFCPDSTFQKGDEFEIVFNFQGEKKISGVVKERKIIANALIAIIKDNNNKYKTLSKEPLEYSLVEYFPGKIVYFLVKDGAIRSVDFSFKRK